MKVYQHVLVALKVDDVTIHAFVYPWLRAHQNYYLVAMMKPLTIHHDSFKPSFRFMPGVVLACTKIRLLKLV